MRAFAPFILLIACLSMSSQAVVLYDASLGTVPGSQGWIAVIDSNTSETAPGTATRLDTNNFGPGDQSGYFSEDPVFGLGQHPGMPVLDAGIGYTIRFELQVLEESHTTINRAGFSMIAISQDITLGMELAFFDNEVWAYNTGFTHGEGAAFDTTAGSVQYDYTVLGTTYSLTANGNPLLSGNLRNYNPTGLSPFVDPYNNPSFLFFGNDTTSADADVLIAHIEVDPPPDMAIPEPQTALPLIFLTLAAFFRRNQA